MKAFSNDLRERIIAAVERKELTIRQIAHHFGVNPCSVVRILKRYRDTGSVNPDPHGGGHPSKLDAAAQARLLELVRQHPDATLAELRDLLGIQCSITTIFRVLKRHEITRKKKTLHEPVRDTPRVQQQRRRFRKKVGEADRRKVIFFDEMGFDTAMTRSHGRSPRGERVVGRINVHGTRRTLIAGMGLAGIKAPKVLAGNMNMSCFEDYVESALVPILKKGDVVVWDRLPAHKSRRAAEMIRAKGARLIQLPVSSPDMNPIEEMFSKLKSWLRKFGARTVKTLADAIAQGLGIVTKEDIQGWFHDRASYAMPA